MFVFHCDYSRSLAQRRRFLIPSFLRLLRLFPSHLSGSKWKLITDPLIAGRPRRRGTIAGPRYNRFAAVQPLCRGATALPRCNRFALGSPWYIERPAVNC